MRHYSPYAHRHILVFADIDELTRYLQFWYA